MTNADRDRRDDIVFVKKLRGALDPRLAPDAAGRIADGAWHRAKVDAPRVRRMPRRSLRWAAAAAALLAAAAGTYVVSRPSDAFAVEGEPVRVWNADGWSTSSSVRADSTVFAPAGTVALRDRNGSLIQPTAGAMFRIEPADGRRFVVRVLRGSVEVSGMSLQLDVGDLLARAADSDGHVALCAQLLSDDPATLAPPDGPFAAQGGVPQIEVRLGSALVQSTRTREIRRLAASDIVTLGSDRQLLDVTRWSEETVDAMLRGAFTVAADSTSTGDLQLHLRVDGDELATLIPRIEMPRVLSFVNFATLDNVMSDGLHPRMHVAIVGAVHSEPAELAREVIREMDGHASALRVYSDGSVQVADGDDVEDFPSLDAARAARPDLLELFAGCLD